MSAARLTRRGSTSNLLVPLLLFAACGRGIEPNAIDLVEIFPEAEKHTAMASLTDGFDVQEVEIDGRAKRAILALPPSRIAWNVVVPHGAVLRGSVALRPEAWTANGDGAVFRVGVVEHGVYRELYRRAVQPFALPRDRRWVDFEVYLGSLAGRRVTLVLATEPGAIGNAVNDAALWGAPRIVPDAT